VNIENDKAAERKEECYRYRTERHYVLPEMLWNASIGTVTYHDCKCGQASADFYQAQLFS
jgi:hypothetical protein